MPIDTPATQSDAPPRASAHDHLHGALKGFDQRVEAQKKCLPDVNSVGRR